MNDTIRTIYSLRSIHGKFSDREISDSDCEQILDAALKTSNASARQSYAIIVLKDKARMRDLFGYQGSRALIFCVDFHRLKQTAGHIGLAFDKDEIISFITGTTDTALAAQTAVIAARSLGIDSLITNGLHSVGLRPTTQYKKSIYLLTPRK